MDPVRFRLYFRRMVDPSEHPAADLAAVLETALDAVVIMSEDGKIVGWNKVAESSFGWSRAEALGHHMRDLIVPVQYRAAHERGLARFLETGRGPVLNQLIEITALHRDGREFPVELSITPTTSGGSRVFLGFLRDITARQRVREFLERRANDAEQLARVTALAAETDSTEAVLRACLAAVCEMTGWPLGHAFECSEADPPELVSTEIWHVSGEDRFEALREVTRGVRFREGLGLPGKILERREPVWITDAERDPNFVRTKVAADLGIVAAFGFPVLGDAKIIAVLEFFSASPALADQMLMPTFRTMGEQIGRVFERRRAETRLRLEKEALEREVAERERIQRDQQILLGELNHRVKNMLAVVLGVAQQTARASSSIDEFRDSFFGRIESLGKAHGILTARQWGITPLSSLVDELLSPFAEGAGDRISVGGPSILLKPKAMLALSMILHELVTNAAKYGSLSIPDGRISLNWSVTGDDHGSRAHLIWKEDGLAGLEAPQHAGFGTKMIVASARHELGGDAQLSWKPNGVQLDLEFPIEAASDIIELDLPRNK